MGLSPRDLQSVSRGPWGSLLDLLRQNLDELFLRVSRLIEMRTGRLTLHGRFSAQNKPYLAQDFPELL